MALSTGPIPRVAFDEIIEESWGDSVAQSLNNLNESQDQTFWVPSSEALAPTTYAASGDLPTVWFTVGGGTPYEITVPDWAHHVVANVMINGIYLDGQGYATYDVQLFVGPNGGRRIRQTGRQSRDRTNPNDRDWFGVSWVDRIECSAIEGDRAIRVRAGRFSAAQRWGVDASSDVAVFLNFQGAIDFYGAL